MPKNHLTLTIIVLAALLGGCRPTSTPAVLPSPTALPTRILIPTSAPTQAPERVQVFFIAGGDNGKSGKLVGCKDSAVPIEWERESSKSALQQGLEILFSIREQFPGNPRLYNPQFSLTLKIESAEVDAEGLAVVTLSGSGEIDGSCDRLRAQAQIEETILAVPGVRAVQVTVNGAPLDDFLAGK